MSEDENVVPVVTGLQPKGAPRKKPELSEDEAAEKLEDTLFGPDAFPDLMPANVRPFTWQFKFHGTTFKCIALPDDVCRNAIRKMPEYEKEMKRRARQHQREYDKRIAALQSEAKKEIAALESADADPLEIFNRECELEDAIAALTAESEVPVADMEDEFFQSMKKFMDDILERTVRGWEDKRWTKPLQFTQSNLDKALRDFSARIAVVQIIINYSQTGQVAEDFLAPSTSRA